MVNLVWLVPLLPLGGAVLMLLVGRRLPRLVIGTLCSGLVLGSFILARGALLELIQSGGQAQELIQYTWFSGLSFRTLDGRLSVLQADWGCLFDPLSGVMAAIITAVGFLIHVYSIGYMWQDRGFYRFFGCLNLFVFFMLLLVLANNYLLLFVGWEGVGLASYLLIGYWFHRKSATDAGIKAFLVNRVGDAGFLLGVLGVLFTAGSVRFAEVHTVPAAVALLLLMGAIGKSAQFPLHVWLPDAMEGPTPVSALIHAATMVTAGVYMVARSHALFAATPEVSEIISVVGAFTALFAATIALVQNDIKLVLAYSTISQLGYMFLALGVGAYWTAIFHLFTHAFFKALLFLGAGSVIHALGGERDMRKMGGLLRKMRFTHAAMLTGALAITGIPGFAGFFSKEQIVTQVFGHGSTALYAVSVATALLTAFYMWRLMYLTFYGAPRTSMVDSAHESPGVMTIPLAALALGSVFSGWAGRPFEHLLEPVFGRHAPHHEAPQGLLISLSVAMAVAGLWLAARLYLREWRSGLGAALRNRWYVDDIYNAVFVRGLALGGGGLLASFDNGVVDGGVNGAGWLTRFASRLSIWWDNWIVDGLVRASAFAVKLTSYPVRFLQTGSVQGYALVFVVGVVTVVGFYLWEKV